MKLICGQSSPNFCLNPISFKHINARQTELDKRLFEKFDPKEWSIVFLQGKANYAHPPSRFLPFNGNNGKSNYWPDREPKSHLVSWFIQSQQAHSKTKLGKSWLNWMAMKQIQMILDLSTKQLYVMIPNTFASCRKIESVIR